MTSDHNSLLLLLEWMKMEETNDDAMVEDYYSQFPNIKQLVNPLISYHNSTLTFNSWWVQWSQMTPPNLALGIDWSGLKILTRGGRLLPVLMWMEDDLPLIGKQKEFPVLSITLFYLTIRWKGAFSWKSFSQI